MVNEAKTGLSLKEKGNAAYKEGNLEDALSFYTQGLAISDSKTEKSILLRNRAAAFLKTGNYTSVIEDCDAALDLCPNEPKALFRRAQALEHENNYEKAYADARVVQQLDPKNKEVQMMLTRLHGNVQQIIEENTKLSGKVKQLLEILFDPAAEKDKRETCSGNLVVLCRERAGSEMLLKQGILERLVRLMKTEKNSEIRVNCIRSISHFVNEPGKAKSFLQECGAGFLLELMKSADERQVGAAQYVFQQLISALTGTDMKTGTKPNNKMLEENRKEIDTVMCVLTASLTSRVMSGECRDAVIEIISKNLPYDALNWGKKFIKMEGLAKLLEIASELPEYKYESCISITNRTRTISSICLDRLYQAQAEDKDRTFFRELVDQCFLEKLLSPDVESKVRVVVAITTLLLGPLDVGNNIIGREGILEMMLAMAQSEDELQQKVSCEALIAAASKKDKCRAIITQGTTILKQLFNSKSPAVRVRALVGLCKLGSLGGTDATMRPFAEGAAFKLADACRKFLVNPSKDRDMRRWACEGLSYLTLDADVKEKLIKDTDALAAMIELAKTGDLNCVFGVVTTFVNLVNAYDQQEILPEMIELAKFAKRHVPEEHIYDDKDFVDGRIIALAKAGAASALVALAPTDSVNSKELIARIFNALCELQDNRGLVVQQGGTKALLALAVEATPKGRTCAAQALARIAITINPEVAFPGQRAYEVVRPLLSLLNVDGSALENFESLMGLCNIAGMSESARQRILKEKGMSQIEHYMFEHHEMIRRAAFQCMTNMCASPDVVTLLEGPNDKLKYLFLATSDEDVEIILAAAGALCMVLPESKKCCHKVFEAKDWAEILQFLVSHSNLEVHFRGTVIVHTLAMTDKEIAKKIIETHAKDALVALSRIDHPEVIHPKAREFAILILDWCVKNNLMDPYQQTDDN